MIKDAEREESLGRSECEDCLDSIVPVDSRDMAGIRAQGHQWILSRYRDLRNASERFESGCSSMYLNDIREAITRKFDFNMVKLASILKDDPSVAGTDVEESIKSTPSDEISAVERLEGFSDLDAYDPEMIIGALESRAGYIYKLIKEWYSSQMEEFNTILSATPNGRIRNTVKKEIVDRYNKRLETISRGISGYILRDPSAAARLFNEYTEIVNRAYYIQNRWEEITSSIDYLPVNETERMYEALEEREKRITAETREKLRNMYEFRDSSSVLEKIRETYKGLIGEHEDLGERIGGKINEINSAIERGETLLMTLNADMDRDDPRVAQVQEAQREHLRGRIGEMKESLERLMDYDTHILAHIAGLRDNVDNIEGYAEPSPDGDMVTVDEATLQSMDFLDRIQAKLVESLPLKFSDPAGKGEIRVATREDLDSSISQDRKSLDSGSMHLNGLVYRFSRKRILTEALSARLSFYYLTHSSRFDQYAVDNRPITLSEFTEFLLYLIDNQPGGRTHSYSIMSSPTGFDRKVMEYLTDRKRLYTRNLSLFIMEKGSDRYYTNDPSPDREILRIINLNLRAEHIHMYREQISSYAKDAEFASIERISEESGINIDSLLKTAAEMEKEGRISLENTGGMHMIRKVR